MPGYRERHLLTWKVKPGTVWVQARIANSSKVITLIVLCKVELWTELMSLGGYERVITLERWTKCSSRLPSAQGA